MAKKFLIILSIALFILIPSRNSFCLAVSAPTNPIPDDGALDEDNGLAELTYDYIAVEFSWDKNTEPEVAWYHVVYFCVENCSGGDATWVIQPTEPGRVSRLFIGGFEFSLPTETVKYAWQVGACSSQEAGACMYFHPPKEFTTPLQPPPPNPCQLPDKCTTLGESCAEEFGSDWGEIEGDCPEGQICCHQEDGNGDGNGGNGWFPIELKNPLAAKTLEEAIDALINFFFYLAFALAPLMIIYAAFLILTAGGRAEQINKGKTIILWTLIAIAIVLLAKGLPLVIKGAMGG